MSKSLTNAPQLPPSGTANMQSMSLQDTLLLADVLAKSGYFPDARTAAQAVVKILAGRELGIPPIAAMHGIHVIKGKPEVGSHLLASRIRGSGRYDYKNLELTDEVCALQFTRKLPDGTWENLEPIIRLTLQQATEKGWTQGKETWAKTPQNMLFARCITNGHKFHCPDLFGGVPIYGEGELSSMEEANERAEIENIGTHPISIAPGVVLPPVHRKVPGTLSVKAQHENIHDIPNERRIPVEVVDEIAALVLELRLPWEQVQERLRDRYNVTSVAHLTPEQAQEVLEGLQTRKQARLAAAAST